MLWHTQVILLHDWISYYDRMIVQEAYFVLRQLGYTTAPDARIRVQLGKFGHHHPMTLLMIASAIITCDYWYGQARICACNATHHRSHTVDYILSDFAVPCDHRIAHDSWWLMTVDGWPWLITDAWTIDDAWLINDIWYTCFVHFIMAIMSDSWVEAYPTLLTDPHLYELGPEYLTSKDIARLVRRHMQC